MRRSSAELPQRPEDPESQAEDESKKLPRRCRLSQNYVLGLVSATVSLTIWWLASPAELRELSPPLPRHGAPTPGTPDGEEDMDAVLDRLMASHRNDVAAREAATLAPLDFPVYGTKDAVVVTMADGGYAACATRLLESARDAGRWSGDLVVLVPTGEGSVALEEAASQRFVALGARLFPVEPELAGGADVRGAGAAAQYGKVALLTHPDFRRYTTILYLDADGLVTSPLQPLLDVELASGQAVAMPTWPSAKVKHESFYQREVNLKALSAAAAMELTQVAPDRTLVGITAWFLIRTASLPSMTEMRRQVDDALEKWRASFRFNDQGLWNVLFYNSAAFYPLCISGLDASLSAEAARVEFRKAFIAGDLSQLEIALEAGCGTGDAVRRKMYMHPLKDCLPDSEWKRKSKDAKAMSDASRKDLVSRYDQAQDKRTDRSKRRSAGLDGPQQAQ